MLMKKFVTLIQALIVSSLWVASAYPAESYKVLPAELDGSMMPYDFADCEPTPSLPDSLTPVYVSYVARHGARYLSSSKKLKPVMDALDEAEKNGTLSDTGQAFLSLMQQVESANEGNWGDLSPIGISEERELGRRMFSMLPPLAKPNAGVNAISTFVPRAVMTMYQFTNQLIRLNDGMTVATDEGKKFSPLLYMFAFDPEYAQYRKDGAWKQVYKEYAKRTAPVGPARRLFTKTTMSDKQLRDLTLDMYEVLKANRAASLPAPTTRWMSEAEYRACWKVSNLQHYLRNSATHLSDASSSATVPLLGRIIADADHALDDPRHTIALNGYFGHAETLMPFLSLIGLPECSKVRPDFSNLDKYWKIEDVTPLAANILFLFAESPTGRVYVAAQLNGRNVSLVPGQTDIVRWDILKEHWGKIITSLMLKTPAK